MLRTLSRYPALTVALLFMMGIAAHAHLPHLPEAWLIAGVLLAAAACRLVRSRAPWANASLGSAIFCVAVSAAQIESFCYPANHISQFATEPRRLAELELKITSPPRVLTGAFGQFRALPPKQVLTATVVRLKTWSGWIDSSGDVLVQIAQPHPRLSSGQTVRAIGLLERPGAAMNPGQFDWASYYRRQRVLVSLQIAQAGNIYIVDETAPGWLAQLRRRARQALSAGFDAGQSLDHALLRALVLGDRDPEMRDVQEQFRRTGTSHHLAISGMHIAVIATIVYWGCRVLRAGPRLSAWTAMIVVAVYGLVALPSPPVVRSVLLCLAFGIGILMGRPGNALQMLSVSVLAMLVWEPLDLFDAGFQLSFGTVLGLVLLTGPMVRMLTSRADHDELVAMSTQPPAAMIAAGMWADRKLVQAVAGALVAWAVSFPLVAIHFQQLNPWAVAASLLMAPVVFVALVAGMLKIILTLLLPALAPTFAALAAHPIGWMRGSVDLLARLPFSDVPLPAPPIWIVAIFYIALLASLKPWHWPGVRWLVRLAPLGAAFAILVLPYQAPEVARPRMGETRITLLAVGAGQCAVVEPPSGRIVLIDAGSSSLTDLLRKCLAPFLRERGRTSIDTILISHANYDHFSAAAEVVGAYDVREVLVGPKFAAHSVDNPPAETMLRTLDQLQRPPRIVSPGEIIPLGRDTQLEILWPTVDFRGSANDASLVVRLKHARRTVLFSGDIQSGAMRVLLEDPRKLEADVLIAPHHGSSEEETPEFLRAVNASAVLSSNDRTLTMKQRNFEKMVGEGKLYRTHHCGAITVRIDAEGQITIEPFRAVELRR